MDTVRLNSSQTRILTFLSTYKDATTGQCTPSAGTIAEAVGLSPQYVRQVTTQLHRLGVIEKVDRWLLDDEDDPYGGKIEVPLEELAWHQNHAWNRPRRGTNLYRVLVDPLMAIMSTCLRWFPAPSWKDA